MSPNIFPPTQLGEFAAALTRLVDPKMASKRSCRAYVEEDDGADDGLVRQGVKTNEESFSIGMERQISASSSSWTNSDGLTASSRVATGGVELGRDLTDIFQPKAPLGSLTTGVPTSNTSTAHPPVNFGVVVPGLFRSGYPTTEDHAFIRNLKLKTIVTLVDREYPEGYKSFMLDQGIQHHVFNMRGTKKEAIPMSAMKYILRLVLDQKNHPLLIHCNHGKHRTGSVVGVIRKLSGWTVSDTIDEYKAYANPKIRECDVEYITRFQISSLSNLFRDTKAVGFRVPNFFRITFFTIFVLAIWMISGSQMAFSRRKAQSSEESSE